MILVARTVAAAAESDPPVDVFVTSAGFGRPLGGGGRGLDGGPVGVNGAVGTAVAAVLVLLAAAAGVASLRHNKNHHKKQQEQYVKTLRSTTKHDLPPHSTKPHNENSRLPDTLRTMGHDSVLPLTIVKLHHERVFIFGAPKKQKRYRRRRYPAGAVDRQARRTDGALPQSGSHSGPSFVHRYREEPAGNGAARYDRYSPRRGDF